MKGFWSTDISIDPWRLRPHFFLREPIDFTTCPKADLRGPAPDIMVEIEKTPARLDAALRKFKVDPTLFVEEIQECVDQLKDACGLHVDEEKYQFHWRLGPDNNPLYYDIKSRAFHPDFAKTDAAFDDADGTYEECLSDAEGDDEEEATYDSTFSARDKPNRMTANCRILLGRFNDAVIGSKFTRYQKSKKQAPDTAVEIGDYICSQVFEDDALPFYVGQVRQVFQYQAGMVPPVFLPDYEKVPIPPLLLLFLLLHLTLQDNTVRFLEVQWWEPQSEFFNKRRSRSTVYEKARLYPATRK